VLSKSTTIFDVSNYLLAGLFAFALAAGVAALAGLAALALAEFDMLLVALAAGEATVAGVEAGVEAGVAAGLFAFALLAGALLAAPPQAIPSALNPRTVESITFFILFKTPKSYSN